MPPGAVYHCVDLQTFHWLIREHPNSGLMRSVAGLKTFVNRPLHLPHRRIRRHAADDAEHQILRHGAATRLPQMPYALARHPIHDGREVIRDQHPVLVERLVVPLAPAIPLYDTHH